MTSFRSRKRNFVFLEIISNVHKYGKMLENNYLEYYEVILHAKFMH